MAASKDNSSIDFYRNKSKFKWVILVVSIIISAVSIYYTNNFGLTWTKSPFEGMIPDESVIGGGDPMIAFDENGDVFFIWILLSNGSGII